MDGKTQNTKEIVQTLVDNIGKGYAFVKNLVNDEKARRSSSEVPLETQAKCKSILDQFQIGSSINSSKKQKLVHDQVDQAEEAKEDIPVSDLTIPGFDNNPERTQKGEHFHNTGTRRRLEQKISHAALALAFEKQEKAANRDASATARSPRKVSSEILAVDNRPEEDATVTVSPRSRSNHVVPDAEKGWARGSLSFKLPDDAVKVVYGHRTDDGFEVTGYMAPNFEEEMAEALETAL